MYLRDITLVYLLSAALASSAVQADHCKGTPTDKLTLCQEFQLLRDLVPAALVDRLIQNHMASDTRFRRAVQYMRSPQFKRTTDQIDDTATFKNILNYFILAGVNTTDIDSVFKIFNCVLIPIIGDPPRSSFRSYQIPATRSFDSFVDEVGRLISPDELIDTLETQLEKNKQFADFYEIMRDASFRSTVMNGFTNRDISRPIKTLRRNQIYLSKLVESVFNFFSLGPEP